MASEFEKAQHKSDLARTSRQSPAMLDHALEATRDIFLQGIAPDPTRVASVLSDADALMRTRVLTRLQQERGNAYVQRVVAESRGKPNRLPRQSQTEISNRVQLQTEEEEEPSPASAENISEAESAAEVEEGTEAAEEEAVPGEGEVGAEIDAPDGLIADSATEVPNPQLEEETEEAAEESTTSLTPISRCPAGEVVLTHQPVSVARVPAAGRARASQVVLEFIPDEKKDASGPMGIIHVRVKGKEVARFFARGGPPPSQRGWDPYNPGHYIAPTPAGRYKLGLGMAVIAPSWKYSQLSWGTPMREVDTLTGKDVQYKSGKRWRSAKKLKIPLTHAAILNAEEDVGRARAIPSRWDLNDFGKLAFHVRGTKSYIHTTPETEEQYRRGRPEKLTFSHGCIHIKPSDRDIMIARGYLQAGVRLIVRKYRRRSKWGTPP